MPILQFKGKDIPIPFNDKAIAQFLYRGYNVLPDPGADPAQTEQERLLVQKALQFMWGDKKFKTEINPSEQMTNIPSIREDAPFKERLPQGFKPDFRNVIPDQTIDYKMQQNLQGVPNSWEAMLQQILGTVA